MTLLFGVCKEKEDAIFTIALMISCGVGVIVLLTLIIIMVWLSKRDNSHMRRVVKRYNKRGNITNA